MTEQRTRTSNDIGTTRLLDTAAEWFVLVEDEQANEHQLRDFGEWLLADQRHADAYNTIETSWLRSAQLDRSDIEIASEAANSAGRSSRSALLRAGLSLAAAASLLVAAFVVVSTQPNVPDATIINPVRYQAVIGVVRHIELADGSQVTLGPGSQLSVIPFSESAELRRVRLVAGEAYFDVAENVAIPFEVDAGSIVIRVTGTAFDVQRKAGTAAVTVAEGSVRVSAASRQDAAPSGLDSVSLGVGQRVEADRTGALGRVVDVPIDRIGAWRRQRLVYTDTPLRQMIDDLKRYQPIDVSIGDEQAAQIRVTGMFDSSDVDGVLASITELFPVDIERADDGSIVLRSRE
ncbi:MAG: FecR domain-containing protein [Pseudomonadota bacterium]